MGSCKSLKTSYDPNDLAQTGMDVGFGLDDHRSARFDRLLATKALADLIAGQAVQCEILGRDDHARALGVCSVADTEVNSTMVRNGWAFAFVKYSDRDAADQSAAELGKAGLWAGSFVKPWEWRLDELQATQGVRDCAIKGNVNREGERIYHMPFQQFYPRTKIDQSRGERWFCKEQEALEAGWRRSLW